MSRMPDIKQVSWGYYRMQIGFWGMLGSFNGCQTAIVLDRGFTSGQAGIFMAASCLSGILCQPILGNWADRHPEVSLKWLFAALMAPAVALNLLFYWTRPSFLPTLLIFLLLGVLELNSYPIIDSMAMQYINTGMDVPYSLGRGLGAFSYAVVCVVEGQLTQRLGVQSALLIHFVLQLVMIGFCAAFPSFPKEALPPREEQAQPHSAWQLLRSNKPFSLMLAGCFFGMVAVMPIVSFLVNMVEAKGGDSGDLGLALFLMAASELPAAFVFQWLHRRMSSQRILLVSIVFMILKPVLFMASGSLTMLLLVQPIQLFGYGLFTPANAYFANESVAPEDRIQGQSLKSLLTSGLGNVVGSLLSGFILDWGGVNAMLTVCALSGCIGLCFGIAAVRCGNKQ